ncbi:hypothetical protein BYT27DRAFT_7168064 [Phlegmacium glaucopus]|nr:hypothetical protein BYT27DRAFT_7168064 [Phlegmacium glaucopus]
MPLNVPGILVPFQLLVHSRLVIPNLVVKDIRQIDFVALKKAGYRGAVFDKDNCLTLPHRDTLVPELQEAWQQCRETFGEGNVLIVSNSAGTVLDAGGIQSESVTYHLRAPVLFHKSFKPAYSCITAIRSYFSSLHSPIRDRELIIVGDRIFTDVVLANRMRLQNRRSKELGMALSRAFQTDGTLTTEKEFIGNSTGALHPFGPLSVWTTGVWKRESMVMRWLEHGLIKLVQRWSITPAGESIDTSPFLQVLTKLEPKKRLTAGSENLVG